MTLSTFQPTQAAAVVDRAYYNISQAAALLGVSRVSVWRWIRDGRLPVSRLGHRTTRISADDLAALLHPTGKGSELAILATGDADGQADAHDGASEHVVQFYESDDVLAEAVAEYLAPALRAGGVAISIATPAHRVALEGRLRAAGVDLEMASAEGRYVPLDAMATLSRLLVDGVPDSGQFDDVIGGLVARVSEGGRAVHAFGEMVALLALEGQHDAALRLEELWNDLQRRQAFSLLCGYPLRAFAGDVHADAHAHACAAHSRVLPAESYASLTDPADQLRAVAALQQRAASLDEALAAERAAREAAEAAVRARDEFLSIASHELRTPLTALLGNAQLYLRRLSEDGPVDPERIARALETIEQQSKRLGRLVGALLDVSRLETGKMKLVLRSTDLVALVQGRADEARGWSQDHQIRVEAPSALEMSVDPLRIEQVLSNLLDNAVKYSPEGGPVDVSLRKTGPALVELAVRDRGLGIPPEQRGQIFERFHQAHADGDQSGLGLGLYLSRQIVEMHGGTIRAEFPNDGGSRFVVELPLR